MKAFTSDPAVIEIGRNYLVIISGFFIFHGALNVYNGVLRGAGDTFFTILISLSCLWIIRIPLAWGLSRWLGQDGIWWGIGISITIGLLITYIYYHTGNWKKKCIVKREPSYDKKP